MERFDNMGATLYTYPGFVPGAISCFIVLLGLVLIVRGLKSKVSTEADAEPLVNRRFLISLICMLVFSLVLLAHAHFIIATGSFVAAFTYLFADEDTARMKKITSACLNGVISSVVVYFLFQEVFLVRLP
jgi:uncharacterized membrane protein